MTTNGNAAGAIALLRTMLTIIGAICAIGAVAVGVVAYFVGMQPRAEAAVQHEAMRAEYRTADTAIDNKASGAVSEIQKVGREVRVIRCWVDPTKSAKAKRACGLEP